MLLFTPDVLPEVAKPIGDIQIGESFTVTVTRWDWDAGRRDGACNAAGDGNLALNCAIAQAILRAGGTFAGHPDPGVCGNQAGFNAQEFTHDGEDLIRAFDNYDPFPGERVVKFWRQS